VLAARFLGEVGDVRRFPSKHHFAAHTGTAPLEASSGQVIRHRLSRAGDRKLNHALYMMAMVQVRRPSAGQAYYRRKLAEGKSPKEALRCLKRRLSDAVYRCLLADQHLQPSKTSAVLHDKEVATTTTSTIASRVLRQGRPSRGSPVRAPGVG
jgi:transposase